VEYEVTVLPVNFKYIFRLIASEEKENTIMILSTRAKEVNARFVIIGSYKVEKKRIFIQTQIYNTVTGELTDAAEVEETIGAIVYEFIEKITSKINGQLQKTLLPKKEKDCTFPL
jgi:TolB-like protein